MKTLTDRLARLISGEDVYTDEPVTTAKLKIGTALIKENLVEIEAAIDMGFGRELVLRVVNQFMVDGKKINLSHFDTVRSRERKLISDLDKLKADFIALAKGGTIVSDKTASLVAGSTGENRECKADPSVISKVADSKVENEGRLIEDPSELRSFRNKMKDIELD